MFNNHIVLRLESNLLELSLTAFTELSFYRNLTELSLVKTRDFDFFLSPLSCYVSTSYI